MAGLHWLRKPHRVLQVRLATVMLLAGLALVAADLVGLRSARQEAIDAAWSDGANLATSFAGRTQVQIEAVTAALTAIRDQLDSEGTSPPALARLSRLVAAARHGLPALRGIAVLDGAGRPIVVSADDPRRAGAVAGAFMAGYRASLLEAPFIGWPIDEDGAGRTLLPVALHLTQANGSGGGAVVALLPLQSLESMFSGFNVGRHGIIALIRADGVLLAREPADAAAIGRTVAPLPALPGAAGHAARVVRTDQGTELLIDSWVRGDALVVRVGRNKGDVLAAWRLMAGFHAVGLLLILGGLMTLSWRLSASIGEREHSHSALRQTHARLKALEADTARDNHFLAMAEEVARVGHWRLTLTERTVLSWSDEVYRLHGVAKTSFRPTPEHVINAFHPDDRERVRDAVRTTVQSGQPFELVARVVWPDSSIRHVRTRGFFQPSVDGAPPSVFGVMMDVTDQVEAEAALLAAHARAEAANAQLEAANHALQALVLQDSLTGLSNRRHFDRALAQEFRRAMRNGTSIGLVLIDVDHFKQFNDLYGHQAGDACLKAIAATIPPFLNRPGDVAARYGGEEIALLLPGTSKPGARAVAERVAQAVRDLALAHAGNEPGHVTISAGVEAFVPVRDLDSDTQLLEHADVALYAAKRAGRDRIICHGDVGMGAETAVFQGLAGA